MAAKFFGLAGNDLNRAKLVIVMGLMTAYLGVFAASVQAAPYGGCNYGTNTYSSSENCSAASAQTSGNLSNTGDNWLRLVYTAGGIVLVAISLFLLSRTLRRKSISHNVNNLKAK